MATLQTLEIVKETETEEFTMETLPCGTLCNKNSVVLFLDKQKVLKFQKAKVQQTDNIVLQSWEQKR